jgi:hypothetical protein
MQTTDHESQTDDHQHEKLVQMNNKLKRALQTFKEKIHRVVTERPDLFEGIGEETNERLDHLISTAENQATQVSVLQAERDQIEQQLQSEIKELQRYKENILNSLDISFLSILIVLWKLIDIKSKTNIQQRLNNSYMLRLMKLSGKINYITEQCNRIFF